MSDFSLSSTAPATLSNGEVLEKTTSEKRVTSEPSIVEETSQRFVQVSEDEIDRIRESRVSTNTKRATNVSRMFGVQSIRKKCDLKTISATNLSFFGKPPKGEHIPPENRGDTTPPTPRSHLARPVRPIQYSAFKAADARNHGPNSTSSQRRAHSPAGQDEYRHSPTVLPWTCAVEHSASQCTFLQSRGRFRSSRVPVHSQAINVFKRRETVTCTPPPHTHTDSMYRHITNGLFLLALFVQYMR